MKKNSYCMLAALFTLLFSNLSFAVDVDPCASWPVTLEEDADGFYEIGSVDALYKFACMVNIGATNISGKLTADIVVNTNVLADADGVSKVDADGNYKGNTPANVWTPIGTSEKPYTGTFDGNGYTIRGLYFNDENTDYVGLFGYISGYASTAIVQNVGVVDSYFKGEYYVGGVVGTNDNGTVSTVYNTGSVSGVSEVGGVVGTNDNGTVSNAYNTGFVNGTKYDVGGVVGCIFLGTVSNAYNTGSVSGTNFVGGVVGNNNGTISNAYNAGAVNGEWYVGGVVGYNDGTVRNVYNTGSVSGDAEVGGVVGENWNGAVSNVYNTGSVSGDAEVGGVVGSNNEGTISNVYNTGAVSGEFDYVGGVVGNNYGTVSNVYNTGSVSGTDEVGGVVGYNDGTVRNGFFNKAYYSGNAIGGGSGTANTVVGKTSTDLANLTVGNGGDFPLLEGETESPWAKGIYYDKATGKLANSELPYLKSLPKPQDVEMEFNVKDNVIQISSTDDLKNFAKLVNEYHITDVDAELTTSITLNSNLLGENNANVNAETGKYTGNAPANVWTPIGTSEKPYTGTFDGNGHTIRGLYFNSENTSNVGLFGYISGSTAKVQNVGVVDSYFKGYQYVGGVVGSNDEGIVSNVYNTGSVSGDSEVGGVVGFNYYGIVSNVYNTGSVSGDSEVGGVVGFYYYGIVSNVYNTGSVSGRSEVGGVVGKNYYGTVSNGFFNTEVYNTEVTCKNCSVVEGTTGMSSEEFADGTVALLLHDWCEKDDGSENCKEGGLDGTVWGQNVGQATGNDAAPTLSGVLKLGPLTVAKTAAGKDSAAIDGASELEMKIPAVFNVPSVTFKRTFAGSGYSTIMLPFTPNCTDDDCVEGVKFFEFNSYTDGEVQATEVSPKDLKANTPYLVSVTDGATELVFKNGGTFNTTAGDAYDSETGEYKVELGGDGASWTIYGTYAYKTWEKGDAGLGKTYGFAGAADNDPAIVGQFAKIGVGAYIYPMRAYLEYVAPAKQSRPAANGAARAGAANTVASLPETINVVIVDKGNVGTEIAGSDDASGEQTTKVIGTINTRTGEFKFANDRWFDLQGRYLGNKKPTQKGAYYNNGKKVIVK